LANSEIKKNSENCGGNNETTIRRKFTTLNQYFVVLQFKFLQYNFQ